MMDSWDELGDSEFVTISMCKELDCNLLTPGASSVDQLSVNI